MSGFIIQRVTDEAYVTNPGSRYSYTHHIEKARIWTRRESAEAEKCGNERVIAVDEILHARD